MRKEEVIMNEKMERMLAKMVDDFNRYSKSVALSYAEENKEVLNWNLGRMGCVEEYMNELARVMGVKLKYKFDVHVYGRGEKLERKLKYRAVEIVKEG